LTVAEEALEAPRTARSRLVPRPWLLVDCVLAAAIWFMASYGGRPSEHPILREHYEVVEHRSYGSKLELFLYERAGT
jgi:hypothetical protein